MSDTVDLPQAGSGFVDALRWNEAGLLPVIAQCQATGKVLMMAWMNREALARTLAERQMWYYSRSRSSMWRKGESSGHTQQLVALRADCDADCLLALVVQQGPACHTQRSACFYQEILSEGRVVHVYDVS